MGIATDVDRDFEGVRRELQSEAERKKEEALAPFVAQLEAAQLTGNEQQILDAQTNLDQAQRAQPSTVVTATDAGKAIARDPTLAASSGGFTTTPAEPEITEEQKAADERLTAQCLLIEFIPDLSEKNKVWRTDNNNVVELANTKTIAMEGDTNYFSSYIYGSEEKSYFLDFTTAQLSSLTPVLKLYKVNQNNDGTTTDYLIPFSTHAGWTNGLKTYGAVDDILNLGRERPMDVGVKSFSWTFEGTNPVSSKRDIAAKLVLFSNSLNNLAEPFNIFPVDGSATPSCFRYIDLALRKGKKFKPNREFDPQYYTIKAEIGWKTENSQLFSATQLKSLELNTTTILLTLVDHQFDFKQDGTLTFTLDYRAYFEGLLFSDKSNIITSLEQDTEIEAKREKLKESTAKIQEQKADEDEEQPSDSKTEEQKNYEKLLKEYDDLISIINTASYSDIIRSLNSKGQVYAIGIDVATYNLYKQQIKSTNTTVTVGASQIITYGDTETRELVDKVIESTNKALTPSKEEGSPKNPDLSTVFPSEQDGIKYITYFYLGDLLNYIIDKVYSKMSDEPNKPNFLVGSALYRSASNLARIATVNILDIPISTEWYAEWFANTIISQKKVQYPLLYFMRDLCSKLINNILSSKCDKSGALKMRNRVNTVNFDVLINQTLNEDYIVSAKRSAIQINSDLSVNEINQIIQQRTPPKGTDTKKIQSYIALYCYDASSPVNINCEDDLKKGIYHFYFGRDRGLVKNINFSRSQVTGLREMNYIRESTGQGLEQLMTPYDVEMKMVGNNLFINGMMIFINPSGFGRKIGQPDEVGSVSYSLKLGGYHTIYRIESVLSTSGFETTVKARWTSSGTPIITSKPKEGTVAAGGTTAQTVDSVEPTCELDDSGFDYPVSIGSVPTYLGSKVPPG